MHTYTIEEQERVIFVIVKPYFADNAGEQVLDTALCTEQRATAAGHIVPVPNKGYRNSFIFLLFLNFAKY
jgi:hypothetical protein